MKNRRKKHKMRNSFLSAIGIVFLFAGATWAMVNPNFTPVHLESSAKTILAVKAKDPAADAKSLILEQVEVIKGEKNAGELKIDFTAALAEKDGQAAVDKFVNGLKGLSGEPVLLAIGELDGKRAALLHANGSWARLSPGGNNDTWQFDRNDPALNSTFNGATDMLLETMRFIRKFPGTPIMPASNGVKWDTVEKIGHADGAVQALIPVAVDGVSLGLHAVCPQGDRLWIQTNDNKFEECKSWTAKSRAAVWSDFNGDGRVDCATLDANGGLKLFLQDATGKFAETEIKTTVNISAATTLHVIALSIGGPPGLVVGAGATPVVLKNSGGAEPKFEAVTLPAVELKDAGAPGPCVVADFTSSGNSDILQIFQKAGVLYRCGADGTFTADAACGAAMGRATERRAVAADLDGDGSLDVLMIGGDVTPGLLVNHAGKFREVWRFTGEPSYIVQSGAASAAVGDFNNDTFQDIFVCYPSEGSQVFFNRGFRSFVTAGDALKFSAEDVPDWDKGQTSAVWADFDRDGAKDLAVSFANGDVYIAKTSLGAMTKPLFIRVGIAPKTNCPVPVNVTFSRDGHCLGVRQCAPFGEPAILGIPQAATYTVQWKLPGQGAVSKTVELGVKSVDLVIGENGK